MDDNKDRELPVGALLAVLFTASCVGAGIGYAFAGPAVSVAGAGLSPVAATLWLVWRFPDTQPESDTP